jgi:UDP-glucuronate decarboxylase
MFDDQMINEFVLSAMDGMPMTIYGTEAFRTSLVYVTDVVSALMKLGKAAPGMGPVNIGGDEEYFMKDVAARVNTLMGSTVAIQYQTPLEFLSEHPMPDINTAKESLGWMPLMRLDNGLERMIDYVTANRHRLIYEGG